MAAKGWTTGQLGDQTGRIALVTGANSGLGYETAKALAMRGATVIMACRSPERGQAALDSIQAENPTGSARLMALDLASLKDVERFAEAFQAEYQQLDLLIANAGLMMPPYAKTEDGFELQIGTNHLGHFALVGRLLALVTATPASRIVVLASTMHKAGKIDLDDLHWERRSYNKTAAYGQSKLANLLFTYELQRRLEAAGSQTIATAAHPGWAATNLQREHAWMRFFGAMMAQTPVEGSWPTLMAATSDDVRGGQYCGPSGLMEMSGPARIVPSSARSHDDEMARELWDKSEELTGVTFAFA